MILRRQGTLNRIQEDGGSYLEYMIRGEFTKATLVNNVNVCYHAGESVKCPDCHEPLHEAYEYGPGSWKCTDCGSLFMEMVYPK